MSVDHSQISVLAVKLKTMPLAMRSRLRPVVKAGAASIAAQAKVNAAFSSRIPGAIYVRSYAGSDVTGASATVGVSAAKAPHARVLEDGNVGSSSTTTFRHPVHGRDWWVTQDMHPFLGPAKASKERAITAEIAAAIETLGVGL